MCVTCFFSVVSPGVVFPSGSCYPVSMAGLWSSSWEDPFREPRPGQGRSGLHRGKFIGRSWKISEIL